MLRASIVIVLALGIAIAPVARGAAQAAAPAGDETALDEARRALRRGDTELAIEVLEEARAEGATDPALRYELYVAHEQAGELAQAAAHLEAYLESDAAIDERERAALRGHLAELRAALAPATGGDPLADPAVPIIGWTLFGAGILGLVAFATSAAAAFAIESGLSEDCRTDERLCLPGERDPIGTAWLVGGVALGAGVLLGSIGGALLVLAGEAQEGATRSLPPDLDPTMQRGFSLRPWVDPRDGGGAGLAVEVSF